MFSLLGYDLCIQNQIELVNNIVYSNYLLCTVRSYCLQSAVSYLVRMESVSVQIQLFHFPVRFWRNSET